MMKLKHSLIIMSDEQKNKRRHLTPANIAASAFNLPIMIIAGVFVGYLFSSEFESPGKEFVIILSVIIFFVLGIFEIYLVIQYEARKEARKSLNQKTLSKLILDSYSEDEEKV